ncbi:MAG: S-layer homology domain-containing protein, partial [Clostridiales bacterium]
VVGSSRLVEGFESNSGSFTATPGLTISACSDKTYVKYGAKALRFGYDFAAAPLDAVTGVPPVILSSPVKYNFSSNPGYLSFWVYGDKSANQLTFSFATPSGSVETMATVVDFTGWRGIAVAIPAEATGLSAVNLRGIGKGTLYLDHLLLSTSSTVDIQAPVINITGFGNTLLAATVRDAVDTDLISGNIKVLLDGKNQNFTYNSASGAVAATIMVNDANSHIISIIATDMSGNVGKTSYYIAADPGVADVFSDLNGHWVKSYGEYLYHQGIFSGIKDKNGLAFQPDSKLTRAQFSVIMANWLHIDTTAYAAKDLPFADKAAIPTWAANSVKAIYSMGVISGYGSGKNLSFQPNNNITRAEALTMIGRVQQRGYVENELTFSDSASIPAWSVPFVKTLVAQGAIGGYENNLSPNAPITRGQIANVIYSLI